MQRDMDLIKSILLEIEKECDGLTLFDIEFDDFNEDQIYYHMKMMFDAGFITGENTSTFGGMNISASGLTWQGAEMLDNIRDSKRWSLIKATTAKAGTFSMGVLQSVVTSVSSEQLQSFLDSLAR